MHGDRNEQTQQSYSRVLECVLRPCFSNNQHFVISKAFALVNNCVLVARPSKKRHTHVSRLGFDMASILYRSQQLKILVVLIVLLFSTVTARTQVTVQDIVPSPPATDVVIIGPAPQSHLGGAGNPDDLSGSNRSQTLTAGDFNSDGIQDIAIAAPDAVLVTGSTLRTGAGSVYIIFGRKDLPATLDTAVSRAGGVDITVFGAADGDRFGFSLAAGDVNGDGFTDLLVGAPNATAPSQHHSGAVFVFLGGYSFGASPVLDLTQGNSADLTIYGGGDRFGAALAVGDAGGPVTSSAIADIIVGAPGSNPDSGGAAYLLYGSTSFGSFARMIDVSSGGADFTLRGTDRQKIGTSVGIGDFNGDGVGDFFAGAPGANRPDRFDAGGVSLSPAAASGAVFGALAPFATGATIRSDSTALLSFYGVASGHQFGTAIAVGDVTGDSVADLATGAPEASGEWKDPGSNLVYSMSAHAGAVYLFTGTRGIAPRRFDAAAAEQLTTFVGPGHAWAGFSLSIGSYHVQGNADRIPDLIIGSPGGVRDPSRNVGGIGEVNVLFGGRTLGRATTRPRSPFNPAPELEDVTIFNPPLQRSVDFGFAVAAGDINGDGSSDLVIAAPFLTAAGRTEAGQIQIRYGVVKPTGDGDPTPTSVSVRVVSPTSGERIHGGQQVSIAWDATGREKVRGFDVLLSTDGGATFSTSIAAGLAADQSSFVWSAPTICASNAKIQVIATTTTGEPVAAASDGSFIIEQRGPGVDLVKSSIGSDSLLLVAASGERFPGGAVLEISRDEVGTSYAAFLRTPKLKGEGKKLKTRGSIDGQSLNQFFPDRAVRLLKLSAAPCATTIIRIQRDRNSLVSAAIN
jgi:hypothetical protein